MIYAPNPGNPGFLDVAGAKHLQRRAEFALAEHLVEQTLVAGGEGDRAKVDGGGGAGGKEGVEGGVNLLQHGPGIAGRNMRLQHFDRFAAVQILGVGVHTVALPHSPP